MLREKHQASLVRDSSPLLPSTVPRSIFKAWLLTSVRTWSYPSLKFNRNCPEPTATSSAFPNVETRR